MLTTHELKLQEPPSASVGTELQLLVLPRVREANRHRLRGQTLWWSVDLTFAFREPVANRGACVQRTWLDQDAMRLDLIIVSAFEHDRPTPAPLAFVSMKNRPAWR